MRFALPALAVALGLNASASADGFVMVGKPGKVKETFIGCKTNDNLEKLKSLVRARDEEAALKFVLGKSPDCKGFQLGETGTVEDNSVWTNNTCLRPQGEPDCFWLPTPLVVAP